MGILAKPRLASPGRRGLGSAGIALPMSLLGIVIVAFLAGGIWTVTDLQTKSTVNREGAARAMHLAEAGAAHALDILRNELADTSNSRLLRGSDNLAGTADDGDLYGYSMSTARGIDNDADGENVTGGSYTVEIQDDLAETDDDDDTDSNGKLVVRCTGMTANGGATATVDVIVGEASLPQLALLVGGNLKLNGNPEFLGQCGNVHANYVIQVSGTTTIQGQLSASDTVAISGAVEDPSGATAPVLEHQPEIEVPTLDPSDYCPGADYYLRTDGMLIYDGVAYDATSSEVFGWKWSGGPVKWTASGSTVSPGTVCAEGNVVVSGNAGTESDPLELSILATGSIEVSGNPFITPAHPEDFLLVAGGDVSISGNVGTAANFEGLVYAGSQCKMSGTPWIHGSVMCQDQPNPAGSINFAAENEISGDAMITYECSSLAAGTGKRRVVYWAQQFGS